MTDTIKDGMLTTEPRVRTADVLYPPDVALRDVFREGDETISTVLGLSAEQRTAREEAFTEMIRATGLDAHATGRRLYNLQLEADVLDARGEQLSPETGGDARADDEARLAQAWAEESRATLRGMYGQERTEELLARADKFVKAHPPLAALLRRHGIGSKPEVVLAIVEHIHKTAFR